MTAKAGVRIWYLFGDDVTAVAGDPRARALLSAEELKRARRFRGPSDEGAFVAGRALARIMVADASGRVAADVALRTGVRGRPHAVATARGPAPAFSITHTPGLVGCAVTAEGAVGLDAEHLGRDTDVGRLARRFFAPTELEYLGGLPQEERRRGFFAVWTLKEAFLKARGEGISVSLASFAFDPGRDPPGFTCPPELDPDPSAWGFRSWAPGPEHVAAVAVRGVGGKEVAAEGERISAPALVARLERVERG